MKFKKFDAIQITKGRYKGFKGDVIKVESNNIYLVGNAFAIFRVRSNQIKLRKAKKTRRSA